jgi:hypothetical protein
MAYNEGSNAQVILTIGAVSGFTVIVLAIGIQAWFLSEEKSEMESKYADAVNMQLVELRTRQHANISNYRWIDKPNQVAAIPVGEAMRVLIESQGRLPATQPSTQPARAE